MTHTSLDTGIAAISRIKQAIKLYNNPLATKETNRHNQKAWLRAIAMLGNNWILSSNVTRKN